MFLLLLNSFRMLLASYNFLFYLSCLTMMLDIVTFKWLIFYTAGKVGYWFSSRRRLWWFILFIDIVGANMNGTVSAFSERRFNVVFRTLNPTEGSHTELTDIIFFFFFDFSYTFKTVTTPSTKTIIRFFCFYSVSLYNLQTLWLNYLLPFWLLRLVFFH